MTPQCYMCVTCVAAVCCNADLARVSWHCIFTAESKRMKTKKIDREFLLTDDSVNCYGFRLLTSGYLKEEFIRNPIGYYMHDRESGVIVKWEDLRVDGDKVYAKPVINMSNDRGQQTVDEIENGFLNGASVGHIVALEFSEDPEKMLPGQTGPTITKWYHRECSLCDVPGNMNALALYDKDGNEIKLADFKLKSQTQIQNMKQIILTAGDLAKLNLTDTATAADVTAKIDNLAAEAAKVPQLVQDLAAANTAKKNAEDALAAEKAANVKANVAAQLKAALDSKCITKEKHDLLATQYEGKPDELKALLALEKPFTSILAKTDLSDADAAELAKLAAKSGSELFNSDGLERLKELTAGGALYKAKYKEAFGEEPKEEETK